MGAIAFARYRLVASSPPSQARAPGDGGQATSAKLNNPIVVAFHNGNLLICDWGNNVIRKVVLSTGIITTIAGSPTGVADYVDGPSSSAQFNT